MNGIPKPVSRFPFECDLCRKMIESLDDLDWHGYGDCVEITDKMWAEWEAEAKELRNEENRK